MNVYQALSQALESQLNSARQTSASEWHARWTNYIADVCKQCLPGGSGFDAGTQLDSERSTSDKLVFNTAFHHMNENGFYDGWTHHKVIIKPAFNGVHMSITGPNRNAIKDLIADAFEGLCDVQPMAFNDHVKWTLAQSLRAVGV
jgi:hypothetical protein